MSGTKLSANGIAIVNEKHKAITHIPSNGLYVTTGN
jgi:hypothetical protein